MRAGMSPAHGMRVGGELQWHPKKGYNFRSYSRFNFDLKLNQDKDRNLWSDMIVSRYTEACRSGETGGLLFSNIF